MRIRSTKKHKNLNAGTLFGKAYDEIHGQTLQILRFFNIGSILFLTKFEALYPRKTHIVILRKPGR